jgi:lipoprotein-releasing system permease protein
LSIAKGLTPFSGWERGLALRYLGSKKAHEGAALISIISFIGIALAVAVLIIVMSVMNGFREELFSKFLGVDAHVYVITGGLNEDQVRSLEAEIAALDGVASVAPVIEGEVLVQANGMRSGALVKGIQRDALLQLDYIERSVRECEFGCGSLDAYGEGFNGGSMVAIGFDMGRKLSLLAGDQLVILSTDTSTSVLGSTPRQKAYDVDAIFRVGSPIYDAAFIFMPLEQAKIFFRKKGQFDSLEIRLDDPDEVDAVRLAVTSIVGGLAPVRDWRDRNQGYYNALVIERNVMRLILMLIVAIAAMNIVAGLVMLVKNKGRDIGILRTMGATRMSILRIFFMAGSMIGVIGTLIGLIVGIVFTLNIQSVQAVLEAILGVELFPSDIYQLSGGLPAILEWSEVSMIASWGFLMSCVATLWPAWRAARLDPVDALRYE